ncbi:unnamed protein product [Brachionus calyciflorus]|uniref:RING-type domain-containing protein n=1 Tax=Brachionus calyciflorus TaxID=104777 RepID=A0A813MMS6_9BILA|nr:unnamed protein product [Brachionus calyciflorus]
MSLINFILMVLSYKAISVNGEDFCFAKITLSNKFDESYQNLELSGLYSFQSQTNEIKGRLTLTKSYSKNSSFIDSQGDCSFDEQIENAVKGNALGLIVISKNSQIFKIKNSKNNPLVVVMISYEMGVKLKALLDLDEVTISINPKNCENREFYIESEFNYQRLSYVSIMFIVIGNLCLLILLGGSCTIFYIIQKTRLVEERERMERLIHHLTRRAISKMKCRKIKPNDKELNEVCVICMETYKVNDSIRKLPCSHIFHKDEIDQWMYENKSCPVCKIDILKYYGIEIESRKNIFFTVLQRLRILRSNQEINEAILAHQNRRRDTVYSIQDSRSYSFFSMDVQNNINELTINNAEQRNLVYAEFQRNQLKSFSLDDLDELKQGGANSGRRLKFFGEKLPSTKESQEFPKIQIIVQDDNQPLNQVAKLNNFSKSKDVALNSNEINQVNAPIASNEKENSNVNNNDSNKTNSNEPDIKIKL